MPFRASNMAAPAERPSLKQRGTLLKLRLLRGATFDRSYVSAQLNAHKEAVSLFRSYSQNGSAKLKDFAQKTLPTLEHHLSMVQDLSNRGLTGAKGATGSGSRAIGPPDKKH